MVILTNNASDVVVVDPNPHDYEKLVATARQWDLRIRIVTSGNEAIRSATAVFDGLWLINTQLPDMAGVELLQLIRARQPDAAVFLVVNAYDQEDEILARSAGPTAFVCKPPHETWLSSLRPVATRARPIGHSTPQRAYTQPEAHY